VTRSPRAASNRAKRSAICPCAPAIVTSILPLFLVAGAAQWRGRRNPRRVADSPRDLILQYVLDLLVRELSRLRWVPSVPDHQALAASRQSARCRQKGRTGQTPWPCHRCAIRQGTERSNTATYRHFPSAGWEVTHHAGRLQAFEHYPLGADAKQANDAPFWTGDPQVPQPEFVYHLLLSSAASTSQS